MSKKASPAAIGGFVLGALALLVGGIIFFSSGKLFREYEEFVSYFPGTTAGLAVGAPVSFQGVQVGEVTEIKLHYSPEEGEFSIPVHYNIWRDAFRISEKGTLVPWEDRPERFNFLVREKGLRASLSSTSLVTGQYIVSLSLLPDTKYEFKSPDHDVREIPTVESTRDRLAEMLQGLDLDGLVSKATKAFDGISALVNSEGVKDFPEEAGRLMADMRKLTADVQSRVDDVSTTLDSTLVGYRTLAETANGRIATLTDALEKAAADVSALTGNVNAKVEPLSKSANEMLGSATRTLKDYDELVDPQSATRANLDTLLEEAAGAARSLRILADYLEQNPDALIKGKY